MARKAEVGYFHLWDAAWVAGADECGVGGLEEEVLEKYSMRVSLKVPQQEGRWHCSPAA